MKTDKIKQGDLIQLSPYEDDTIKVIGIVYFIGRSWISKKQFIKIKGVKLNSYGDILYFKHKIWEFDFNKIEFLKYVGRVL